MNTRIQKPETRGLKILLIGIAMGLTGVGIMYIVYQIYGTGAPDIFAYLAYGLVFPGFLLALIGGILHLFLYFDNRAKAVNRKKK